MSGLHVRQPWGVPGVRSAAHARRLSTESAHAFPYCTVQALPAAMSRLIVRQLARCTMRYPAATWAYVLRTNPSSCAASQARYPASSFRNHSVMARLLRAL